jgi:hypothetical protein
VAPDGEACSRRSNLINGGIDTEAIDRFGQWQEG